MPNIVQARSRKFRAQTPQTVTEKTAPDHLTLERRKLETEKENNAGFSKYQRAWDMKNTWLQSSYRQYVRCTTQRRVKATMNQYELRIEGRRERLRSMLEAEEEQFLQEANEKKETLLERQARMREKANVLRDTREAKRLQMVSEKLEQHFINQCEELRPLRSKRKEEETRLDWAAQARLKQKQEQEQQKQEQQFAEMWEASRQREEQKEIERVEKQQQKTNEHKHQLRAQMDAVELQRQQDRVLKEEEARLLREHGEMMMLQVQREEQQRLTDQQARKKMLDESYRMKMKRLAKEQQTELALDMKILQQVSNQASDEKLGAERRKIELREEQQKHREYLAAELEKQKQLEQETEQVFEENLREMWAKREKQSQMERDARDRLMKDVMETRSEQIQYNLELNKHKQDELAKEKEELIQKTEESKVLDQEEKRQHKESRRAYLADLQGQIQTNEQLKLDEKALEEWEFQYGLAMQKEYERMKEKILSRLASHNTVDHPFTRSPWAKTALLLQRYRESSTLNH